MKKKITLFDIIVGTIMVMWGFFIFYPFYNSVLVSFMSNAEYMRKPFAFYVANPTLAAYREIFRDGQIFYSFRATLIILAGHLPLSLFATVSIAYALSRKRFFMSRFVNNMAAITMYFGGGTIPLYLLIRSYGLIGSYASVIIIGSFSVYNMILVKNYFISIPDSLEESAKLDGANDLRIFAQIYLPLAKPIIATITLFIAVDTWNTWYNPMLFLTDSKKWPLQLMLREMIQNATVKLPEDAGADDVMVETFALNIQMAAVVVTMLPIMLVYPFVQKYFMGGITLGAVKG